MPSFRSHIEVAWEDPNLRRAFRTLATTFRVVMFDRPGSGLSERLGTSGTSESAAADVLAILDHAGIQRACLFATSDSGPTAIRIAAQNPERVERLLLFGTMAKGMYASDYPWAPTHEVWEAWLDKLLKGWGGPSGIEDWAPSVATDPRVRAWWARMLRQSVSPASLRVTVEGFRDTDVRSLLQHIKAPTLVMHRRGDRACRYAGGEFLAQGIPNATLVSLEGEDHWWWQGALDEVLRLMLAFANGDEPQGPSLR
jgi:pimeloyl-ACP methyl ester carboxylesterase